MCTKSNDYFLYKKRRMFEFKMIFWQENYSALAQKKKQIFSGIEKSSNDKFKLINFKIGEFITKNKMSNFYTLKYCDSVKYDKI